MRLAHFFIHIFKGEIYGKLKNIHLGKSRLILKKAFLICLHSSTLIYIRLHLSTFIQACLVTLLHSSTFVQVRLLTRLHSFTFVHTRLHSPSDAPVLLEQIINLRPFSAMLISEFRTLKCEETSELVFLTQFEICCRARNRELA